MIRLALAVILLPLLNSPFRPPTSRLQDKQITVVAQVIACRTGAEKKALPAGKLDAIAKELDKLTSANQFEVIAAGSVRTEDGVFARVTLGTAWNLSLQFKPVQSGAVQLSELQFSEEKDQEVTTITPTSTVKELRRTINALLRTKFTVTDEEPVLVGVAGVGDVSLALVVRTSVK